MDYKEKYERSLDRAEKIIKYYKEHNRNHEASIEDLESVFPELKESEDEKIKETLIDYFKTYKKQEECGIKTFFGIPTDNIIAWLEKQKLVSEIVERCKNSWYNEGKIAGMAEGLTNDEKYQQGWHDALEKQGEPADKVGPKFHEGDWIIDKQGIVHQIEKVIENVTNNTFAYDLVGGGYFNEEVKSCRLWTIQDAKDGDVLYSLDSKQPFIFKHRKPNEQAEAYCGLNIYGKFFVWGTKDCVITLSNYIPATKEQRDTLLKAMADAGYTFDFEKKELKLLISNGGDFESNNSKQKPTWSDEDDKTYYSLLADIRTRQDSSTSTLEEYYNEQINWLKSLKERLS